MEQLDWAGIPLAFGTKLLVHLKSYSMTLGTLT